LTHSENPLDAMGCDAKCLACALIFFGVLDVNIVAIIAGSIVACNCCGSNPCCAKGWMIASGILTLIGTIVQIILGIQYITDTDGVCQDWFEGTLVDKCYYGCQSCYDQGDFPTFSSDCWDAIDFINDFCKDMGILDIIGIAMIGHGAVIGIPIVIFSFVGACKAQPAAPTFKPGA